MLSYLQIGTGFNASDSGVFIPISDLAGVTAGELNPATPEATEGKITYGFLNSLFTALGIKVPLGFSATKTGSDSGTPNIYRESVKFKNEWILDLSSASIDPIPLNTAGDGKLTLADVFPSCQLKTTGQACSGEGLLFPHILSTEFGGQIPGTLTSDARAWFQGAISAFCNLLILRSGTIPSAIRQKSNLLRQRMSGATISDTFYAATSPLSGLLAAEIPHVRLISEDLTIEYEFLIDTATTTLEVRVATA